MTAPLALENLAGTVLEGDILLLQVLAEGGMGVAYKGRQQSLNRDVCVKFMHSLFVSDDERLERFRREARVLSQLKNEHIVKVYFVGMHEYVYPYIAMELLQGESLRDLTVAGTLGWQDACELIVQVSDAMEAVHAVGIVHRDLKPDNIFVTRKDNCNIAKILDFGLCASASAETLTQPADLIGSVAYMAPECFTGSQRTPQIDVYALGCTLYEILTGTVPFADDNPVSVAWKHAHNPFPELPEGRVPENARQGLNAILQKTCAKSADVRLASCQLLSDGLRKVLGGAEAATVKDYLGLEAHTNASNRRHPVIIGALVLALVSFGLVNLTAPLAVADFIDEGMCGVEDLFSHPLAMRHRARAMHERGDFRRAAVYWRRCLGKTGDRLSRVSVLLWLADSQLHVDSMAAAASLIRALHELAVEPGNVSNADSSGVDVEVAESKALAQALCILQTQARDPVSEISETPSRQLRSLCSRLSRTELASVRGDLERIFKSKTQLPMVERASLVANIAECLFREHRYSETIEFLRASVHDKVRSLLPPTWTRGDVRLGIALGTVLQKSGASESRELRNLLYDASDCYDSAQSAADSAALSLLCLRTFETVVLADQKHQFCRIIWKYLNAIESEELVKLNHGKINMSVQFMQLAQPVVQPMDTTFATNCPDVLERVRALRAIDAQMRR